MPYCQSPKWLAGAGTGRSMSIGGGAGTHHDPPVLWRDRLPDELERHLDAVPAPALKGVRIPGLATLAGVLPRKIQEIPGIMHGGVGWQGIIPSRAAKMGSIAVDKGIAKLGSPSDFYEQLDPELIAEHIVASSQDDLHELVERTMEREHPALWRDLPPRVRAGIHERVQRQLPDIVRDITRQIGENIDQLLDVKLMVIRHMDERPELCNR